MLTKIEQYGVILARGLISVVFFLNAFDVLDQARPLHEMVERGVPAAIAPAAVWAGRILQLFAGTALLLGFQKRLAALALAAFLIPATLIAHPFWVYLGTPDLQNQLANFGKNLAIIGGLFYIASFTGGASSKERVKAAAGSA